MEKNCWKKLRIGTYLYFLKITTRIFYLLKIGFEILFLTDSLFENFFCLSFSNTKCPKVGSVGWHNNYLLATNIADFPPQWKLKNNESHELSLEFVQYFVKKRCTFFYKCNEVVWRWDKWNFSILLWNLQKLIFWSSYFYVQMTDVLYFSKAVFLTFLWKHWFSNI